RARRLGRGAVGRKLAQEDVARTEVAKDGGPEERAHDEAEECELERRTRLDMAALVRDDRLPLVVVEGVEESTRHDDARAEHADAERALSARREHVDAGVVHPRKCVAVAA